MPSVSLPGVAVRPLGPVAQCKRPVAWIGIERSPGSVAGSPTARYQADAVVLADQATVSAAA